MNQTSKFLTLYPNIVIVKGYNRSIIADLYKKRFRFVPNLLADILDDLYEFPKEIEDITLLVDSESRMEIINQVNLLVSEDYLVLASEDFNLRIKRFPTNKTEDSKIVDCIIELSQESDYPISSFLNKLNLIGIKFLEIRFLDISSFRNNFSIIQSALQDSTIEYLQIIAPEHPILYEVLQNEYSEFSRLNLFTIYNASKSIKLENTHFEIEFSTQEFIDSSNCGCISPQYFRYNIQNYNLNRTANNCLSRKLSIDHNGKIKNCPSKMSHFGIFDPSTIDALIESLEFQKEWAITKDKVLICSDCEFRWMCSDCRVFIQDEKNPFSKPSKCQYNPYINKWEWEIGYKNEAESGISINGNSLIIDEEKLNQINLELWD